MSSLPAPGALEQMGPIAATPSWNLRASKHTHQAPQRERRDGRSVSKSARGAERARTSPSNALEQVGAYDFVLLVDSHERDEAGGVHALGVVKFGNVNHIAWWELRRQVDTGVELVEDGNANVGRRIEIALLHLANLVGSTRRGEVERQCSLVNAHVVVVPPLIDHLLAVNDFHALGDVDVLPALGDVDYELDVVSGLRAAGLGANEAGQQARGGTGCPR
jgi:hypothetical protein